METTQPPRAAAGPGQVLSAAASGLRRRTDRFFAARLAYPVVLAVLLLAIVANEVTYRKQLSALRDAVVLTDLRLQAAGALQALTDAETAQRGYLITGRDEYLKPYEAAQQALTQTLEPMLALVAAANADAAEQARQVRALVSEKLGEMSTTIALKRGGQGDKALVVLESDLGQTRMAAIRDAMASATQKASVQQAQVRDEIFGNHELRRWMIHLLAAAAAAGTLAYMRRLRDEVQRREAARQHLEHEVAERTADLRELATHLQTVREAERARLARELHDELGGLLTAAKLDLARVRNAQGLSEQALERLASVSRRLDGVVALKRRIIEDLRPSALDHLGLAQSLNILCQEVAERIGRPVHWAPDAAVEHMKLAAEVELTAYRLVQESLTNVQKYASAHEVRVALGIEGGHARLSVEDDGIGFDARAVHVSRHGLAGMRYRVEALGGHMSVRSQPGQGTRIEATLPLQAREETAAA